MPSIRLPGLLPEMLMPALLWISLPLPEMMLRAADLAGIEAERGLKTLVGFVEPALILAFGGLVAFVAAALLQAVYSLSPAGL